jgi:3-hydroxyisobutyrate dehydrogenase-like beta-hydroxyacid dehydrogenase
MRVGFIGTGNMGAPMAANLLSAGNELAVHDLLRETTRELEAAGASWADSPKAAAAAAEVVCLSLPGPPEVEDLVVGNGGLLDAMGNGSIIVDLSTNSPSLVKRLAERAGERGVGFLDAPVSGGVRGARKGTLAVMVGGDPEHFATCTPLLNAIGGNVFHVGEIGAGNVAKLINNMLAFSSMMANAEALVLGAKAGVDLNVLWKIVRASSGANFAWEYGARAILRDRLAPTFAVDLACKDIGLATEMAAELDVSLTMGTTVEALLRRYQGSGFAREDVLATVKALEEVAGVQVRGTWDEGDA